MRLISKRAFRDYLKFRGITNEQLASDVTALLRKSGSAKKCSPTTIAFLRSEGEAARHSCGPEIAAAIEKALNAPPGSLFSAHVVVASPTNNRGVA